MRVDAVMPSTLWHAARMRARRVAREAYDSRMPTDACDPALVARLRAAGCVFAEDEAALLTEAVEGRADAADELERLVARRVDGGAARAGARLGGVRAACASCSSPACSCRAAAPSCSPRRPPGSPAAIADDGSHPRGRRPVLRRRRDRRGRRGRPSGAVELVAADLDPAAVRAARRNLEPLGARVVEGDLFDALPRDLLGRVDVLAVNAPYVPTDEIAMMPPEARDHEARVALDGGGDGLDVHRRVAASAREWLAPGGHLLIETSRRQAPTTAALVDRGRPRGADRARRRARRRRS